MNTLNANPLDDDADRPLRPSREHRRRRLRRHGRRAYIRSVYFLPSLATLGNAICGFGSMYVASMPDSGASRDPVTLFMAQHTFMAAAYLIFFAMIFDGLDGRLARFARHTTDFGGQLDSLADAISFGAAPAMAESLDRLCWACAALFMSCALLRLARFNVSNKHGEQHHFSFLGLPSPGAAGAVAAFVLLHEELSLSGWERMAGFMRIILPLVVCVTGLLMISNIRYPHLVNRYLRGRRSLGRLIVALVVLLMMVVDHRLTLAIGCNFYALWGLVAYAIARARRRAAPAI
jgi:CDP-diacylglycerol--serine O-phosphatidyltransferase